MSASYNFPYKNPQALLIYLSANANSLQLAKFIKDHQTIHQV